jgi:hypothetical protein
MCLFSIKKYGVRIFTTVAFSDVIQYFRVTKFVLYNTYVMFIGNLFPLPFLCLATAGKQYLCEATAVNNRILASGISRYAVKL